MRPAGAQVESEVRDKAQKRAFNTNSPPPTRWSDNTAAHIWTNKSYLGTPPNRAKACSIPAVNTAIVCRQ